ncbi:2-nitropropane dioxygenase [Actinokineospora fastidiosa]|uniref:Propionate 3-nitronate monooxygenase n=1 Tax=Actinokineospora fastidiosa TaxID=1816 RepID=A0A918LFU8_9PSEU|nr:2-nitropropane dioxygenase [Actinokineospora fastidiosa]
MRRLRGLRLISRRLRSVFSELAVPIVVAPMAGGVSTPELVVAAVEAGATAFLPGGYLAPAALAGRIESVRAGTDGPFGVNLFVPGPRTEALVGAHAAAVATESARLGVEPGKASWDDDRFADKVDLLVRTPVPAISFTFGLPDADVLARLRDVGSYLIATVTTPEEGERAAEAGVDALCVQGAAAGGHRGTFTDDPTEPGGTSLYDLLPALRLLSGLDLPLVAAGGLMHGADVAAVLAAGAVAAQLGTAFLRCPEAGTARAYRDALAAGGRETALTRAFSGRPARGLVNRFLRENPSAPSAYPQVNNLTRPMRAAGDAEVMSLWAGQAYPLGRDEPVAEVIARLLGEARTAADSLTQRLK